MNTGLNDIAGMTAAQNAIHEDANAKGALMFTMETVDQFLTAFDAGLTTAAAINDLRDLRDAARRMGYIEK